MRLVCARLIYIENRKLYFCAYLLAKAKASSILPICSFSALAVLRIAPTPEYANTHNTTVIIIDFMKHPFRYDLI